MIGHRHAQVVAAYQTLVSVVAWLIVLLNVLSIANILRTLSKQPMPAFLSWACTIATIVLLFAPGIFPDMLVSNLSPDYSLNIKKGTANKIAVPLKNIDSFN